MSERRAAYFAGKCCATCRSTVDLELDHKDPKKKVSHKIWSWSAERREAELAKCQVLCKVCHKLKSSGEHAKGERQGRALLKEGDVRAIRVSREPRKVLATRYGVSPETVKTIRAGRSWKHVT